MASALNLYAVPVHVPMSADKRAAFDGMLGQGITPVSVQTVVARDQAHARELAEKVIHDFLGDPTVQTFTFKSEVEEIDMSALFPAAIDGEKIKP